VIGISGAGRGRHVTEDVVTKLQTQTYFLERPVVDAAAEVEEVRRRKWVTITKGPRISTLDGQASE
jgi:hypothetical protein